MNVISLKECVKEVIDVNQGIKAVDLVCRVFTKVKDVENIEFIPEILEQLVNEERVVRIEYTLDSMPDRVKAIYLPKGTALIGGYENCDDVSVSEIGCCNECPFKTVYNKNYECTFNPGTIISIFSQFGGKPRPEFKCPLENKDIVLTSKKQ